MKPLIGIAGNREKSKTHLYKIAMVEMYATAILQAGGIPVILPLGLSQDELACLPERLDGIVLAGGADVDPALFHGGEHPAVVKADSDRDVLEIALVKLALQTPLPLLGICRGMQVMNVALNGGLYTHILDQHPHALQHSTPKDLPRDYFAHSVSLETNSQLYNIIRQSVIPVNSHHHQGVDKAAPGLVVSATASDGLIEAVELPGKAFFLGVQWHPEWLLAHQHAHALFNAFIEAAVQYHHDGTRNV